MKPHSIRSFFLLTLLGLLLSACATKINTIKSNTSHRLNDSEGYLLLGLDANESLQSLVLTGKKHVMFTGEDLKYGSNYLLAKLPAGDYRIERVRINKYSGFKLLGDVWDIEVVEGNISYGGNVRVNPNGPRYPIELINHSSSALEYIEQYHPGILTSHKLRYSGQGEDKFFKLVRGELNK